MLTMGMVLTAVMALTGSVFYALVLYMNLHKQKEFEEALARKHSEAKRQNLLLRKKCEELMEELLRCREIINLEINRRKDLGRGGPYRGYRSF